MNRRLNQFFYSFQKKPVLLRTKFSVLSTNPAGVVAIPSLSAGTFGGPSVSSAGYGRGIAQVYGFSSAPAAGNNVASGNLSVQLTDPYKDFLGYTWDISSVVTGGAISITAGLTAGVMYQIVTVGTSTVANWQAEGVPVGVTPQPGVVFIAATAAAGTGTGTVKALASSQVTTLELGGDPALTLNPNPVQGGSTFGLGAGGWLYFQLFKTAALQQPTDGAIVTLSLLLAGE